MRDSRADIEREIVYFFHQLYIRDLKLRPRIDGISFRQLSNPMALEVRFTKGEIKQAVFDLGGDHASVQMAFL